jgi:hypothetical protein
MAVPAHIRRRVSAAASRPQATELPLDPDLIRHLPIAGHVKANASCPTLVASRNRGKACPRGRWFEIGRPGSSRSMEVERKFLVEGEPALEGAEHRPIEQG